MDILSSALAGTKERKNASRPYHVDIYLLGHSCSMRGEVKVLSDKQISLAEYELSKNGSWVPVQTPPIFILREIISAVRIVYLDGAA